MPCLLASSLIQTHKLSPSCCPLEELPVSNCCFAWRKASLPFHLPCPHLLKSTCLPMMMLTVIQEVSVTPIVLCCDRLQGSCSSWLFPAASVCAHILEAGIPQLTVVLLRCLLFLSLRVLHLLLLLLPSSSLNFRSRSKSPFPVGDAASYRVINWKKMHCIHWCCCAKK